MNFTLQQILDHWIKKRLYPFQQEWLRSILKNNYTAILACRQVGKSYVLGFAAMLLAISEGQDILIISENKDKAQNIISILNEHLDTLEKVSGKIWRNKKKSGMTRVEILGLAGVATITARPGNPKALQGFTGTVFIDELAINTHDPEQMLSQALSVGSSRSKYKVVVCSNASHHGSFVYKMFRSQTVRDQRRFKRWKILELDIWKRFNLERGEDEKLPARYQNIKQTISSSEWRKFYENSFEFPGTQRFVLGNMILANKEHYETVSPVRVMGIDPGWTINPTGICIIEIFPGQKVNVVATQQLYKTPLDEQIKIIEELQKEYNVRYLVMDQGGAIPMVSELEKRYGKMLTKTSVTNKFYIDTANTVEMLLEQAKLYINKNKHSKLMSEVESVGYDGANIKIPTYKSFRGGPLKETEDHCDIYLGLCLALSIIGTLNISTNNKVSTIKQNTTPGWIIR